VVLTHERDAPVLIGYSGRKRLHFSLRSGEFDIANGSRDRVSTDENFRRDSQIEMLDISKELVPWASENTVSIDFHIDFISYPRNPEIVLLRIFG